MRIERCTPADVDRVLAAGHLFDEQPDRAWTEDFLRREGHHLLLATVDGRPAGFVSGVEVCHPDKGLEMCLYELGVDEEYRGRGIGRALTDAVKDLAVQVGCRTMWVLTEPDNAAALATYRSTGAVPAEDLTVMLEWELPSSPAG